MTGRGKQPKEHRITLRAVRTKRFQRYEQ